MIKLINSNEFIKQIKIQNIFYFKNCKYNYLELSQQIWTQQFVLNHNIICRTKKFKSVLIQSFNYNNSSAKEKMSEINYKEKMSEINQDSNSLSFGFVSLQMRAMTSKRNDQKTSKSLNDIISEHDHRLITQIFIISPIRLQSSKYRKQLKNYRFQRKNKSSSLFNTSTVVEEKETQQLFTAFKDVFNVWRDNLTHKFYLLFSNGDLIYFYHKNANDNLKQPNKKGGSFAILSCKKSIFSKILQENQISYKQLDKTENQSERLLISNLSVKLFWVYLTNYVLQNPLSLQIITNFCFMNSFEVLPIETYNGKQQRPQFEYIAEEKTNIFSEKITQVFALKIQGLYFKHNLDNLKNKLDQEFKNKKYYILVEANSGSEDFKTVVQQCDYQILNKVPQSKQKDI